MSYGEQEPTSSNWMAFGITSVMLQTLAVVPVAFLLMFMLAFCDAPGMCDWTDVVLPVGTLAILFFMCLQVIALIRRRFDWPVRIVAIGMDCVLVLPALALAVWFAMIR